MLKIEHVELDMNLNIFSSFYRDCIVNCVLFSLFLTD